MLQFWFSTFVMPSSPPSKPPSGTPVLATSSPPSLYTYLILARTTWSLSNTMLGSVEQASRSSLLTIFATLVILLGFLSLADIAIAYVTGNDLFLLQVIYDLLSSPPSVDDVVMYGVTGSVDVINQTINQSVI